MSRQPKKPKKGMPRFERRDIRFVIAATVLHLIALPGAAALAPRTLPIHTFKPKAAPLVEIDIDVAASLLRNAPIQEAAPAPSLPTDPAEPGPRVAPDAPTVPRAADQPAPESTAQPADTSAPTLEPAPLTSGAEDPNGVPSQYTQPLDPGAYPGGLGDPLSPGGMFPLLPEPHAAAPAPTSVKRRKIDTKAADAIIADGLRKEEGKLGLDFPGRGPIRSAFVAALYASGAPYECRGNFGLTVSGAGKVTGISLNDFTGGSPAIWETVRKQAKAELSSATLIMRSGYANGAAVGVTVKSSVRLPSGGASRDGLKINFDPTDIGARETRHVSAFVNVQPIR